MLDKYHNYSKKTFSLIHAFGVINLHANPSMASIDSTVCKKNEPLEDGKQLKTHTHRCYAHMQHPPAGLSPLGIDPIYRMVSHARQGGGSRKKEMVDFT